MLCMHSICNDVNNIKNSCHPALHRLIRNEGNQKFSTIASEISRQYLSLGTIFEVTLDNAIVYF